MERVRHARPMTTTQTLSTTELAGGGPRVAPSASAPCLGTTVDEATAFAILDRFAEAGGTFIDTANNYMFSGRNGRRERGARRSLAREQERLRRRGACNQGGRPSPPPWRGSRGRGRALGRRDQHSRRREPPPPRGRADRPLLRPPRGPERRAEETLGAFAGSSRRTSSASSAAATIRRGASSARERSRGRTTGRSTTRFSSATATSGRGPTRGSRSGRTST